MLALEGLADVPVLAVIESTLDAAGMLPAKNVDGLAEWLTTLAGDPAARSAVVRRTLTGAVASILRRVPAGAAEAAEQLVVRNLLTSIVTSEYDAAANHVAAASTDGTLMRGAVLAQARGLVGTGPSGQPREARIARLGNRVVAAVTGRQRVESNLAAAVETELVSLVTTSSAAAARAVQQAWQENPAAQTILADPANAELGRTSTDLAARATTAIRSWEHATIDLVRRTVSTGRATARAMPFGVNGLGVVLMMQVLSGSAEATDAVAPAAHRILASVLDDRAATDLAQQAQANLHHCLSVLMYNERSQFDRAIERLRIPDDQVGVLATATAAAALALESLPT